MTLSLPLTQVQEIFVYAFMRIKGWWHKIMEHLIVSLFKWRKNETLFKKIKSKYDAHFRKTSNLIWLGIFVTFRSVEPLCHYYRLRSGVPSPILNRPQYQIGRVGVSRVSGCLNFRFRSFGWYIVANRSCISSSNLLQVLFDQNN